MKFFYVASGDISGASAAIGFDPPNGKVDAAALAEESCFPVADFPLCARFARFESRADCLKIIRGYVYIGKCDP